MAYKSRLLLLLLAVQTVYCEEYLLALAKTFKTAYISATTGHNNGSVWYKLCDSKEPKTSQLSPFSRHLIPIDFKSQAVLGIEDKAFLVNTSGNAVSISGSYRYAGFAPLPVSGLGTKYMLPFCGVNQRKSLLVIASYKDKTSVNITLRLNAQSFGYERQQYNDGEVISQTLNPFQTFTFKIDHDVTGTAVDASNPVAVFMGSMNSMDVDTYEQLLPVSAYGDEYVVAVKDETENHTLQIISAEYGNEIHFSDGKVVKGRFHSEVLEKNETVYFTTTKPVMATVCRIRRYRYNSALVVVPPVHSYRKGEVSLYVPFSITTSTVKVMIRRSSDVEIRSSEKEILPIWKEIPGSGFKVGTCQISNNYSTSISSNDSFAVLAFSPSFIQNSGLSFLNKEEKIVKVVSTASSTPIPTQSVTNLHVFDNGTKPQPEAEKISQNVGIRSSVAIVGLICGLVILTLIVVLAALVRCMRKRRASGEDISLPGTSHFTS